VRETLRWIRESKGRRQEDQERKRERERKEGRKEGRTLLSQSGNAMMYAYSLCAGCVPPTE